MHALFYLAGGEPRCLIHDAAGRPQEYAVAVDPPGGAGPAACLRRLSPGRAGGGEYVVCVDGAETLCDCRAFRFGCGGEHGCKHVRAALDLTAFLAALGAGSMKA